MPANEIRFLVNIRCDKSTLILSLGITYSTRDINYFATREAAVWVL